MPTVRVQATGWINEPVGLTFGDNLRRWTKLAVSEPSLESEALSAFVFDGDAPKELREAERTGDVVPVRFAGQKDALLVKVLSVGSD